jgi:hypothetical protein
MNARMISVSVVGWESNQEGGFFVTHLNPFQHCTENEQPECSDFNSTLIRMNLSYGKDKD